MKQSAIDRMTHLRAQHQSLVRATRLWRAAAVWLSLAAGAVAADVGWSLLGAIGERDAFVVHELPGWMRLAMLIVLIGAAIIAVTRWRLPGDVRWRGLGEYAWWVEREAGIKGNELVNAVGIAKPKVTEDALRGELARRVMARADACAQRIEWDTLIDRSPMRSARRQAAMAGAMCVVLAASIWAMTGDLAGQVLRIVEPLGDQPPAALTQLDLHELQSPAHSDMITLRMDVRGRSAEAARLRLKDGSTLDMHRNADGSFEVTLRQLNAPLDVQAEASNTRTAWMTIAAKLSGGEPVNASTSNGQTQGVEASEQNTQGHSGTGTGHGDEQPLDAMSAAVGTLLERIDSAEQRKLLQALVEQAPAAYREQVARYLMNKTEKPR